MEYGVAQSVQCLAMYCGSISTGAKDFFLASVFKHLYGMYRGQLYFLKNLYRHLAPGSTTQKSAILRTLYSF
jgi:hypothetical protein